jgi:hypothetical protein
LTFYFSPEQAQQFGTVEVTDKNAKCIKIEKKVEKMKSKQKLDELIFSTIIMAGDREIITPILNR